MRDLINIMENTFEKYPGSLVYDNWSTFAARLKAVLATASSEEELCQGLGIDHELYDRVISSAMVSWRASTSTSMLHGVGHLDGIPKAGTQIFPNLVWQTRFLLLAMKFGPVATTRIPKPNPTKDAFGKTERDIVVSNTYALSSRNPEAVNDLLRIVYAYRAFSSSRPVKKLPKAIYRGIRAGDLWSHADLKDIMAEIFKKDIKHNLKRKQAIDVLLAFIIKHGMNKISDGRLLSFSASKPIAEYFTKGQGFIIQLDPSKVEIVTSELHDERVAGKDHSTGKNEREYIVRIPGSFVWSQENFVLADLNYFVAEQNPLCVAYLDHNDKEASYEIDGIQIIAKFQWNSSGNVGTVKYRSSHDSWGESRGSFKKTYGVDPLPTEKNLASVLNFKIYDVKTW